MEKIQLGEAITLDDGKEFSVVDIVEENDNRYIYLAREDDNLELLLGKEIIENDELIIEPVNDKKEAMRIMQLIVEKNKA